MVESTGAAKADDVQNSSASIEEDNELAKNDAELLAMQKQRSIPRVSLSNVGLDGEQLVMEVDDFGKIDADNLGMAAAGQEEKILQHLERQGSFDPEHLVKIAASPGLKASG